MKPYYSESGITIYHGDCREVLPGLTPPDLVLTDPPYNFEPTGGGIMGASAKDGYARKNLAELDALSCCKFDPEDLFSAVNANSFVVFTNKRLLPIYLARAVQLGLLFDVHFLWKNNPTPVKESSFLPELEYIVVLRKPGSFWCKTAPFADYRKAFIAAQAKGERKAHPAQKPPGLMMKYLRVLCPTEGVAVDPYMGSGTTLFAAKQLGRRAIGIEIEERYCEIAAKRLEQEVLQFSEPAPEPVQDGLFESTEAAS